MKKMMMAVAASIFCAAPAFAADQDLYANEAAVPSEELNALINPGSVSMNEDGQAVATEIDGAMSSEEMDAMDVEQAGDQDVTQEENAEMDVMRGGRNGGGNHGGNRGGRHDGARGGRSDFRGGHRWGNDGRGPGVVIRHRDRDRHHHHRRTRVIIRRGHWDRGPIVVRPAHVTCFAQNGRGMVFRASGNRPGIVQTRALNKCYAQSRNCRPMGCR